MTTRPERTSSGALDAIRDLERTLSDTVEHRASAAESRRLANETAADLITAARTRGAEVAEQISERIRSANEVEALSIQAEADDEIAVIRDQMGVMRERLLAEMRAAILPEAHAPVEV